MTIQDIQQMLIDHKICGDVSEYDDGTIEITIEWGDWKHDHIYCDMLMEEKGYE